MFRPLRNDPMPYPWGDLQAIPRWRGESPTGLPQAELWFGTHVVAPSMIEGADGDLLALSTWLADQGVDSNLSFLVKVLAASTPLSIQVHPSKSQAVEGFAKEQALGITLDDPTRNYRDESDKPELLIAWNSSFEALVGFVSPERGRRVADQLSQLLPSTDLSGLWAALDSSMDVFVEWLFGNEDHVAALASDLSHAFASGMRSADDELNAIWSRVVPLYPHDTGIVAASFMNFVSLSAGEAMFVPAGVPHAYLRGFGLEVMAPSDNVLRAGLTPKHRDPSELLRVVRREPFSQAVLGPDTEGPWKRWTPPNTPFEVRSLDGDGFSEESRFSGPLVAVVEKGEVRVSSEGESDLLRSGTAYVAVLNGEPLTISGTGRVFFISGL